MDPAAEQDVAFALADAAAPLLSEPERTAVFAMIGAGDVFAAMTELLTAARRHGLALPAGMVSRVSGWLNGYAGVAEEPTLRAMLQFLDEAPAPS